MNICESMKERSGYNNPVKRKAESFPFLLPHVVILQKPATSDLCLVVNMVKSQTCITFVSFSNAGISEKWCKNVLVKK